MAFGRFERSTGGEPMSDINMTPLIDVMLVLLVIFILTAPLLSSKIALDLPKAAGAVPANAGAALQVVIDRDGRLYLSEKAVTAEDLASRLVEVASTAPDTELQLRADEAVAYGRVVEVIAMAQRAGLQRVGFVATDPAAAATQSGAGRGAGTGTAPAPAPAAPADPAR